MRHLLLDLYSKVLKMMSLIFRIKKNIVFSSNTDFCDNSKALYDYLISEKLNNDYRFYWIVKNIDNFADFETDNVNFIHFKTNGFISKLISEIKINHLLFKTKYYFFSHTNYSRFIPKKNQVFYNLTHGTPLKNSTGRHHSMKFSSHVLSTSEFASELRFATYEDADLSKLRILGFPRNDLLFADLNLDCLDFMNLNDGKIIIWMPTYRRHKDGTTNDSGRSKKEIDIPILDTTTSWEQVNELLNKNGINLIVKPHPEQDMEFFNVLNLSNIRLITNEDLTNNGVDLYGLLSLTDALITDYSSVYMDYLLTDNPIGFTIDDLDSYSKNLGFMVEDPIKLLPGDKIRDVNDFLDFIKNLNENNDLFLDERNRVKLLFNKYMDGKSSYRIFEGLKAEEK